MIIGYVEQSYFGGIQYIKIYNKENEKYTVEYVKECYDRNISNIENIIKKADTIRNCEVVENGINLIEKSIHENKYTKEIKEYLNNINLNEIVSKKYYNNETCDGLNWEIYIEKDENKYQIEGYEEMPEEIKMIKIKLLRIIAEAKKEK